MAYLNQTQISNNDYDLQDKRIPDFAAGDNGKFLKIKSDGTIEAGAGGEPTSYLKNASVSNDVLTITKKDDSTVSLDVSGKELSSNKVTSISSSSTDTQYPSAKAVYDSIIDLVYPVGSIYMSVNSISPQTFIGGTWEQIEDTFLLSAGSTYTAGTTGGEASHTLTSGEMPSHSHTFSGSSASTGTVSSDHTHNYTDYYGSSAAGTAISTAQMPSHYHDSIKFNVSGDYYLGYSNANPPAGVAAYVTIASTRAGLSYPFYTSYTGSGSSHSHSVSNTYTTRTSGGINQNHSHSYTPSGSISNSGSGSSHNNMPPYLAVYMWKRIA